MRLVPLLVLLLATPALFADGIARQTLNDGQLVLEGIPEIPAGLAETLDQYQNTRSTFFLDWREDCECIYVKTRFNGVNQVHRINQPGSARRQLTFSNEPVGEVVRQPTGRMIAFTMNRGGSGFDQIFLLDPDNGSTRLLTDGESLNNRMIWDRAGQRLAYRSTRRNGVSNDIWMLDLDAPNRARMILEAPDGALWKPVEFSPDGKLLLVQNYGGITDSRIYLLDLESGELRLLVGDPEISSSSIASGFDNLGTGVHFVSNQRDRAAEIGWIPVTEGGAISYVPNNIPWDVTEFELSADGKRGAFVTNEEGISRLYLFDPERQRYKLVKRMPFGVISGLKFSPNGRQLGMTVNTSRTPSDAYVLELKRWALGYRGLTRWTFGEVGGLDPEKFVQPELVHFSAPMQTDERTLSMPAFVYLPDRKGPAPVVIYIHGGPEGQFRPSFNSTIQMWVEKLGVAVIAPNVRGSLGYGMGYLYMDDGKLRENAVRDIGALLDWIGTEKDFDPSRVAVFGSSYGGYMALASTVHFGERIRAAVDRSGISNFVTYLENTQGYRRDLRRMEYGDERIPQMREFLQQISPLNNVDRIRTPLLIVQGQNDPVVPVTESEQMVRALRERGQKVWYMNALNEGHGYEKKENRDVFQQVSYLFLKEYLLD